MTPSRIHRLILTHFRNYRVAGLETRGNMVALVGPNGAGKTNCLEAISFLSPGRGLRRATLEDVADNQGDGSWAVSAEVEGALGLATLGTGIDAPQGEAQSTTRRCRIDREPVGSASAFGDHLRMVWLTPAMDGLFMGAASERRRFFDRLVLAIDSEHSSRVSALERSLRSRNRLLEVRNFDDHWCDAIERETAELAVAVAATRGQTAVKLAAMLRARGAASAFPSAEIALDGWMENALLSRARHRRGGPLPPDPARGARARRRRRPHAGRPASHRPASRLRTEDHAGARCLHRRAESAADRAGAGACGAGRRDHGHRSAVAARRGRRPSRPQQARGTVCGTGKARRTGLAIRRRSRGVFRTGNRPARFSTSTTAASRGACYPYCAALVRVHASRARGR